MYILLNVFGANLQPLALPLAGKPRWQLARPLRQTNALLSAFVFEVGNIVQVQGEKKAEEITWGT